MIRKKKQVQEEVIRMPGKILRVMGIGSSLRKRQRFLCSLY